MPSFSQEEIELLSRKYKEGTLTEEERHLFTQWYAQLATELEHSEADTIEGVKERILAKTHRAIGVERPLPQRIGRPRSVIKKHPYLSAAAVLLLLGSVAALLFVARRETGESEIRASAAIVPGSDKATLTLANGQKIDLTAVPEGRMTLQDSTVLLKQADGEVQFAGTETATGGPTDNQYNTLNIPKGGQWKLLLKDGTRVWLNTATTLRFPVSFTGKTREIFLEGEAYFEVAKDIIHPFIVHANNQTVEVLGTHFNVNAYTEENTTQTTLLEGEVRINRTALLKPGQKAINNGALLKIQEADTEQAIAWKEGNFIFNGEDLGTIMRQISRWYNVEVQFRSPELKEITFSGSVSRSVPITTLIHRLSLTKEASFTITGNTIIVAPYTK